MRQSLTRKPIIQVLLVLQLVTFVLLPANLFTANSQEWWLPVILAALVIIADANLIFSHQDVVWPWNLMAFSQGINIISRLMMIGSHATISVNGQQAFNTPYVVLTLVSMLISTFILWFVELPEVRMAMVRD
jgi:hypothetical protein